MAEEDDIEEAIIAALRRAHALQRPKIRMGILCRTKENVEMVMKLQPGQRIAGDESGHN